MKKLLLIVLSIFLLAGCKEDRKYRTYSMSENGIINSWGIPSDGGFYAYVTGGGPSSYQPAAPFEFAPGASPWGYVDYDYMSLNLYSQPNQQGYIGSSTYHNVNGVPTWKSNPAYPKDKDLITFTKTGMNGDVIAYDMTPKQNVTTPPIISNNWSSGMDNKNQTLITPGSYWVQDYGFDDVGRWAADGTSVAQSTDSSTVATQPTYGSRAYPIHILNDQYKFDSLAPGTGFDGVWQMDIKIGSNSGAYPDSLYCETFYLAERKNLLWGASQYSDGSDAGGPAGWSTEIDIMETKWQKTGPQINIPTGGNPSTGWNPGYTKITTPKGLKVGEWSEAGATNPGGPTPDFVTFGAQIANDTLYFYGYLPGQTKPWYTEVVPRDNSYVQKYPFVPYIGTWTDSTTHVAGGFKTMYKNFIYKKATDVKGNPISNPTGFGPGLK